MGKEVQDDGLPQVLLRTPKLQELSKNPWEGEEGMSDRQHKLTCCPSLPPYLTLGFISIIWVICLNVYVYHVLIWYPWRPEDGVKDHVNAGNQTWVPWKHSQWS